MPCDPFESVALAHSTQSPSEFRFAGRVYVQAPADPRAATFQYKTAVPLLVQVHKSLFSIKNQGYNEFSLKIEPFFEGSVAVISLESGFWKRSTKIKFSDRFTETKRKPVKLDNQRGFCSVKSFLG